jgi:sulfhydrogenase subunit gamma (sulfur reductase)
LPKPSNPYLPSAARIEEVRVETPDTKTFKVVFCEDDCREGFSYRPGHFAEVSVFGIGEAPFCINSTPTRPGFLEFSIKRMGRVTSALHEMIGGEQIGVRGPLGNSFPVEEWQGRKLLFIGGGIGLAPLRSAINYCLDNRSDYGEIDVIYGARSPADLVYKPELEQWAARSDMNLYLTVDAGNDEWKGRVGFVPALVTELGPSPENTIAITCGPPIMIRLVLQGLAQLGFNDEQIVTTLEMRMKCGIGKCGRCNIGRSYVCVDGPVYNLAQLKALGGEH